MTALGVRLWPHIGASVVVFAGVLVTAGNGAFAQVNSAPGNWIEEVQFRPGWFRSATPTPGQPQDQPRNAEEPANPTDQESGPPAGDFVFAGDLAKQLRKIDPAAKVEWDGHTLRVEASGQKFSVFPTGREMVVNGAVEKSGQTLKVRAGEIYVPQSVVDRIGQELERKRVAGGTTSTLAASPTPAGAVAVATAPPVATVLPEVPEAPAAATPTPRLLAAASATPALAPAAPEVTPSQAAAATPQATEVVVTPIPTAPPAPITTATPFPVTATPRPTATPVPTVTPTPVVQMVTPGTSKSHKTPKSSRATPTPKPPSISAGDAIDPVRIALKDKADLANYKIPTRRKAELESLAANGQVHRVVIHADDSDFDSVSSVGKQGAQICLEIAQRLKTQLQSKGIDSVLTRASAERVPLGKKLETINNSGAQVLIIISVGQNPDFSEMSGYRILYVTDSVDYSAVKAGNVEGSDLVPMDLYYRSFQSQNKVLGSALLNTMNKALDRDPVGINPAPLYLAKRAPMASAEVVVGYLTNPADARRLSDTQSQDRVAAAIVEGITDYASHLRQAGSVTR